MTRHDYPSLIKGKGHDILLLKISKIIIPYKIIYYIASAILYTYTLTKQIMEKCHIFYFTVRKQNMEFTCFV